MTTRQDGERRRGRRPGGTDTKAALLAAAREVFIEQGYDGATVRAIARRAGVDAAMVNHWFGGKEALFAQAVLQLPFNPQELIANLLEGDPDSVGERIVRTFLTTWDAQDGGVFAALIRSVASHDQVANALRDFFIKNVFSQLASVVSVDGRAELRANLVASQMIGLGMVRYVAEFEPLARTDIDTLVKAIGPTLQRYLNGPID
ncbi:TetR/AcrR family transcriptional regulator [Actinokineospora iranica]|uniref:DNA-binding transcriptional regulator, AcrR family n=1 Tax=Actinokineospora iranica TaxID=1271860 RepID=A0A1G6KCU9_9PSEU|nr:TetR family transcriptional regulator [Actinokineospora iranica]SDC28395.1 DNA-binding transcriptional regulator, AcrR family [Actinokineospora iranica]